MTEEQIRQLVREELSRVGYTFSKNIQILDGRNIQVGRGTGTKIGTETGQRLGFFNASPLPQRAAISAPTGGSTIDTQARDAINLIRQVLIDLGFTA